MLIMVGLFSIKQLVNLKLVIIRNFAPGFHDRDLLAVQILKTVLAVTT